jgi:hypothetical protein
MYKISPFTPLFWSPTNERSGARSKYVQTFAPSDRILVQAIRVHTGSAPVAPSLYIYDVLKEVQTAQRWRAWTMNTTTALLWATIQGLQPGIYTVRFGNNESEPFCVTDDESLLAQTTLIQYSMENNRQRDDAVFVIDGLRNFFDWRIPGGFKDDGWSFGVDNEQFTSNVYDVVDVYSRDLTMKTLTLGNSQGCPVWYGELLNRIFSCTYVYVDGVRYSRHESDVPEVNATVDGLRSYIFKQTVQQVRILDPVLEEQNQLRLRRIIQSPTDKFRFIGDDSPRKIQ